MSPKKKAKIITFSMYADTLRLLDAYSKETRIPKSAVIRNLIEEVIPAWQRKIYALNDPSH